MMFSETEKHLLSLLTGSRRNYIYGKLGWKEQYGCKFINSAHPFVRTPEGKPLSLRRKVPKRLSDKKLLEFWRSNECFIGLPFDVQTRFLILDIDKESPYRTPEQIKTFIELFASQGIHLTPFRSSPGSLGVHLLALFDKPVNTHQLATFLTHFLESQGYHIGSGMLEPFPRLNLNGTLNRQQIRLPFQQGYALLDENLCPIEEYETSEQREAGLLSLVEENVSLTEDLNFSVPIQGSKPIQSKPKQVRIPKADKLAHLYKEGEAYFNGRGLTRSGERQAACKAVLYYLRKSGLAPVGFEQKQFELAWDWLEKHHNGCSQDWNQAGPEFCRKELRDWVFKAYQDNARLRMYRANKLQEAETQERIQYVTLHILNTQGEAGLFRGGHINQQAIKRVSQELKKKAEQEEAFWLEVKKNQGIDLRRSLTIRTLSKYSKLIHSLWLEWKKDKE